MISNNQASSNAPPSAGPPIPNVPDAWQQPIAAGAAASGAPSAGDRRGAEQGVELRSGGARPILRRLRLRPVRTRASVCRRSRRSRPRIRSKHRRGWVITSWAARRPRAFRSARLSRSTPTMVAARPAMARRLRRGCRRFRAPRRAAALWRCRCREWARAAAATAAPGRSCGGRLPSHDGSAADGGAVHGSGAAAAGGRSRPGARRTTAPSFRAA